SLEEAATQNAEADGGAQCAHAEDDSHGEHGHGLDMCNIFHSTLLDETDAQTLLVEQTQTQWCSWAMARYTTVKTMNMKACSVIPSGWKIAHASASRNCTITNSQPLADSSCTAPCSESTASSRKIISPANRLPYRRSESEIGRARKGTISRIRLAGISSTFSSGFFALKGCRVNSAMKPPSPFILRL